MSYLSTRGGMEPRPFSDVLLGGLAPDGGLVVPETYPELSPAELAAWRGYDYRALACAVLGRFVDDLPAGELRELVERAYSAEVFGSDEITPLRPLGDGVYLLGLSNGPTLAFKDVAMQLLGHLFDHVLARQQRSLNILGATSGDTGSAAEYAMRGKTRVRVFMLSPHGKMSPFQTAQMFSLDEPNVINLAVRGVFDDCQDLVKRVNADADFKRRYAIGAVNSINWGRVVAQVVYYFKAYFAATDSDGEPLDVAVPSGNFGNIYAGHVARQMGLPLRRLILATNENDVLDEFFRGGPYRARPAERVFKTSSPSMDISKASNFERFIYDLVGRDPARVRELWRSLHEQGGFELSARERRAVAGYGFVSGVSRHADRLRTIREVYQRHGEIIDPHTADGLKVGLEWREPGVKLVCQETALAAKFADTVVEALGRPPPRPQHYRGLEDREQHFQVIDADDDIVKNIIAEHSAERPAEHPA